MSYFLHEFNSLGCHFWEHKNFTIENKLFSNMFFCIFIFVLWNNQKASVKLRNERRTKERLKSNFSLRILKTLISFLIDFNDIFTCLNLHQYSIKILKHTPTLVIIFLVIFSIFFPLLLLLLLSLNFSLYEQCFNKFYTNCANIFFLFIIPRR